MFFPLRFTSKIQAALLIGIAGIMLLAPVQVHTQYFQTEAEVHDELAKLLDKPVTKIGIPGLNFSELKIVEGDGTGKYLESSFLAEYIAALYRYMVAIISIIAVIVLMVAGIQWLLSGGNQQLVGAAKKRITGAIAGLILAVGSYTILYTLNPELVQFRGIQIAYIEPIGVDRLNEEVTVEPTVESINPDLIEKSKVVKNVGHSRIEAAGIRGISYGFNDVPYFAQFDQRWGPIRYGKSNSCSSYGKAGCGPAAFAMVLKHYEFNVNPTHVGVIAYDTGARSCPPGGTNSRNTTFIKELEKTYGVVIDIWENDRDKALQILRQKKPLIISGASEGYNVAGKEIKYGGHFMVLTGIEKRKIQEQEVEVIRVNDPGNRPKNGITYMTMEQFEKKRRFIYLHPRGEE